MAPVIAEQGAVPPAGLAAAGAALPAVSPSPAGASSARPLPRQDARPAPRPPAPAPALGSRNRPGARGPLGQQVSLIPTHALATPCFSQVLAPLCGGATGGPTCRFTLPFMRCPRASHPCPDQGTVELCLHSAGVKKLTTALLAGSHLQVPKLLEYVFQQ